MTPKLRIKILKNLLYFAILFFAYILQSTPGLIDFYGVRGLLVLSFCVCIAVFEGEFTGAIYGFIGGLFCDSSASTIFGFNAFLMTAICALAGLGAIYFFRRNLINVMIVGLAALFARAFSEFFFSYVLYGYPNIKGFFYWELMPEVVLSSLFILPFYYIVRYAHLKLEPEIPAE